MKGKKAFSIVLSALILASFLTACNKDKPADNTPAPTAKATEAAVTAQPTTEITEAAITEVPAVETTEDAAPEPVKYNEQDYKLLRDFFELTDEDGVKNGEKCFKDYNPDDPSTWNRTGETGCFVRWNENHRVDMIGFDYSDTPIVLSGELDLTGLDEIRWLDTGRSIIKAVRMTNPHDVMDFQADGEESVYVQLGLVQNMYFASTKHIHCEYNHSSYVGTFGLIDLTVDGAGSALVSAYGEDYLVVYIEAFPSDGHKFVGWYDTNGNLVSTESRYQISSLENMLGEGEFIYTAKFE